MSLLIGDALEWFAENTPEKVAVVGPDGSRTYSQLWSRSCKLANAWSRLGVRKGDRVAILMTNCVKYVEVYEAAAILGVAVVPLNFRFVAREADYILDHSNTKLLIYGGSFSPLVAELKNCPQLLIVADGEAAGRNSYEELLEKESDARPLEKADPDECFYQGYTSGTTGLPKGCVNLHGRFMAQLLRLVAAYGITADDVHLIVAPIFHEAPVLFALTQLVAGGTVVLVTDGTPAAISAAIEQNKITGVFMVPTMWNALAISGEISKADFSSLRLAISAGSPLLTHTKLALLEQLPHVALHEFYGATEFGMVTNLGPADQRRKTRSVGRPLFGMHVKLLDENGEDVSQGEVGEIYVRGPILLAEYYHNPEATAASRRGEWFTLGDMGRFDEEGYLYIVDRKKDMIISGGENIFPNDIEEVIAQHPAVMMCAVIGAPDPHWGEAVVAAVVLKPDGQLMSDELLSFCKLHLANFKVPKRIDIVPELPVSSFGKVLRREVRKTYWERQAVAV